MLAARTAATVTNARGLCRARVVPLFYWLPEAEMRSMLSQVNGVLFTGGDAPLEKGVPYFDAVLVGYSLG